MTTKYLQPAICECKPLVNRPFSIPSTTGTLLALLIALVALVVLHFGRPKSFEGLRRWVRLCCLRLALREVYYDAPPTLAQLRVLPLLPRVAGLTEFRDSYAKDGPGALYFTAVVDNGTRQQYDSGLITADAFLAELRVKVGHAKKLPVRQGQYRKCNVGRTHFWLFCFYPSKRILAEQICHLCMDVDAPRAILECNPGCKTTHREYWWLKDLGGFSKVEKRLRGVLALLGQGDLPRKDLDDVWLLSLV
ncbi:hypothetical protein C8F04DRAFT_1258393 [Mycena alexandri]|uniref:Uncharacterized protein n=1 Tax=Mycena alexandri TaxID=1745969 RepID=A0AAD6X8H6_9AGAR|nr:hypothetical protein C8F04DRAFT_1258393 [Mycena alexandri]